MIGQLPDDSAPRVARFEGRIALLGNDEGEDFGFLISPIAAVDLAAALLSAVEDVHGEGKFVHDVDAITFQVASNVEGSGEDVGFLTFRLRGAPLSAVLNPIQITELAAAFAAAAKHVDRPAHPRPDR